jgi:hypothetical protein
MAVLSSFWRRKYKRREVTSAFNISISALFCLNPSPPREDLYLKSKPMHPIDYRFLRAG